MEFVFNDGGRAAAGFKGDTGDCVCRAIAIATGKPYKEVYDLINSYAKKEKASKRQTKSSARTGVRKNTTKKILADLGWIWTPTMQIGSGCKVHLKADELPSGKVIVQLSQHLAAVVDGVVNDTYDCTRDEERCVYGYWTKPDERPKLMTVNEVIKKFGCGKGYNICYNDVYGCDVVEGVDFTADELGKMKVKSIVINFPTNFVRITVLKRV